MPFIVVFINLQIPKIECVNYANPVMLIICYVDTKHEKSMYTHRHTDTRTQTQGYTHTHIYTQSRMHTHTHTHTHTYTHTRIP